jgi:hypothetical protein
VCPPPRPSAGPVCTQPVVCLISYVHTTNSSGIAMSTQLAAHFATRVPTGHSSGIPIYASLFTCLVSRALTNNSTRHACVHKSNSCLISYHPQSIPFKRQCAHGWYIFRRLCAHNPLLVVLCEHTNNFVFGSMCSRRTSSEHMAGCYHVPIIECAQLTLNPRSPELYFT